MPRFAGTQPTDAGCKPIMAKTLVSLFTPYPRLSLSLGKEEIYQRFRRIEPSLVSYHNSTVGVNQPGVQVLVAHATDSPAGVASFLVETNGYRSGRSNQFARIDLVIVSPQYRGLGLGRLLMFAVIIQLLEVYRRSLYSISCLAAHPAVEKCLEEVGFCGQMRAKGQFKHEEIKLEALDVDDLLNTLVSRMSSAMQMTNFRLRQRQ